MSDISIRISGRAGRITLTRVRALNAMSYAMCRQIAAALEDWRRDPSVDLVIFDAEGDRAFCAGGDIRNSTKAAPEATLPMVRRSGATNTA